MKLAHQPARMHHAATLSPPPSTSCAYFPSLRGGCTLCALIAPVSAISVSRFFPSSSAQPLCFLSYPCNPSSFMQLRILLRNGAALSLLFSMASALFLSPRGCTPPTFPSGPRRLSALVPRWQIPCSQKLAASSSSLCALFRTPFLCFQELAASFAKTPGWGVPRFLFQPPTAH